MSIFRLGRFVPNREFSLLVSAGGLVEKTCGAGVISYGLQETKSEETLLFCKIKFRATNGIVGKVTQVLLPWGDFVMMRKQMLRLKALAEAPDASFC